LLRIGFWTAIVIIVIVYAIWRTYNYALGPNLSIESPISNITSDSTIHIKGNAQRINFLSLNDHPIMLDPQGNFDEEIIVFLGMNILTLKAKDRFDRQIVKKIEILRQ